MARTHTFFNVGHGDAILIEAEDYIVVRDLGQSTRKYSNYNHNFSLALNKLQSSLKPKYAIISHGHTDHVTGFVDLFKNKQMDMFETSYIPPLVMSVGGAPVHSCLYNKIYFLLYLYASLKKSRVTKRNISNWLILLPVMIYLSKRVKQVSCGDGILNGEATVLWPEITLPYCDPRVNLTHFYETGAFVGLGSDIQMFLQSSNPTLRQYASDITEMYQRLTEERFEGENKGNYCNECVKKIIQMLKGISCNVNVNIPWHVKKVVCEAIKNDDDNQGVVFQFNDSSAIYLSDLYVIDALVTSMQNHGQLLGAYGLLKSSHHGSRFGSMINIMQYYEVVHTCGVGAMNHKGPDVGYSKPGVKVVCNDWDFRAKRKNPWDVNVLKNCTLVDPKNSYSRKL